MLNDFTLLYVEDDKTTQECLKIILEDECKKLYIASNGDEGIKIYKRKKPDIVVSDINMPNMDGITMIEEIKQINKNQPIIYISAYDDKNNLLKAINMGCNGFIQKPINVRVLLDRLNEVTQKIVEERKKLNAKNKEIENLYNLAHYDFLTNIPNRFLFEIELKRAISMAKRNSEKVALFFIDLDNFKKVNDNFGHKTGDFVLKSIVENLNKIIRKEDILSRRSGDEFLLMTIGNIDEKILSKLADKIIKTCVQPLVYKNEQIFISCSIGISIYPDDADNFENLIINADKAMYEAKRRGKADYIFYNSK